MAVYRKYINILKLIFVKIILYYKNLDIIQILIYKIAKLDNNSRWKNVNKFIHVINNLKHDES